MINLCKRSIRNREGETPDLTVKDIIKMGFKHVGYEDLTAHSYENFISRFRNNILPPSSGSNNKRSKKSA
jgi:hypothetical protein